MSWIVAVLAFGYAVTATFGAWTVARRKPRLATGFMISAACLTVGGVGAIHGLYESVWIVATGAALASVFSYVYARIVLRAVVARNHLGRAAFGALLTLATWAVGPAHRL